jgi:hypothetical protein
MPNDLPIGDPKKLWQNQPTERPSMTLKLIRSRARQLHAETRWRVIGTLAGPLLVLLLCAFWIRTPLRQVLGPLGTIALIWSLAGLYFLNRGMWSGQMPGDAGLSAGLAFCRSELERQRDQGRRTLLWLFGPVMMAIGTVILGLLIVTRNRSLAPILPFLILVLLWIVVFLMLRLRGLRQLQYEIEELNDLESDNAQ